MNEFDKVMEEWFKLCDQNPSIIPMMLALLVIMVLWKRLGRNGRRALASKGGFLDSQILDLGGISFTGKMATEGMFVCAELGWGKTFLVFQKVLKGYLRAGMGIYILGAKAEDLPTVERLFRDLGLRDKLVVIGPKHPHRINCFKALESIAPPDGIEEEMIGFFSSLLEIESRSASNSAGEDSQFFISHGQRLLGAILVCLRLAGKEISATTIYRFLVELPQTPDQLKDENWQKTSYANEMMMEAFCAEKSEREKADYENARLYLQQELCALNPRTKTCIISTVSGMLSKLLRGWMAELWSSTTTVRFHDAFDGKCLYFDTSPLEYGEYGVFSLVMAKYLAQRTIQRRLVDSKSRPVALMGDEWQAHLVKSDRDHQAITRQKLGCTWAATQNVTGLYSVLGGGQAAESMVKSWIALFGAKVFGANTDWTTNTYASELCGSALESFMAGSVNHNAESAVEMMKRSGGSSSWSQQYQPVVRPEHFVRLRKPEPPLNEADAIVIMPRLQQATGQHWAQITLRPEK